MVDYINDWYLGLDQASYDTGIAIAHGATVFTAAMHIRTTRKHPVELIERCARVERVLDSLCQVIPFTKAYTEYVHTGQMRAYQVLVKIETTIHNYFYKRGLPFAIIKADPLIRESWPRLLNFGGTKEHVRLALDFMLPSEISEHELDAIGVLYGSLVRDNIVEADFARRIKIVRLSSPAELLETIQNYRTEHDVLHPHLQLHGVQS